MAEKQSVIRMSSLIEVSSKPTHQYMMLLYPKKRREKLTKKRQSEISKAYPAGMGNTYGIDHLTIGEATHSSDESE